jgi:hypothetical protein
VKYHYQTVKLHPWIGKSYGHGLYKHPILILGESEYDKYGQAAKCGDTNWCINEVITGEKPGRKYFPNIASMFLGREPETQGERSEFWQSVAYYNYVQEQLPSSRTRPNRQMWRSTAPEAFREVLAKHKPKFVVVLGFDNWRWLLAADRDGPVIRAQPPVTIRSRDNDIRRTYWYKTGPHSEALAIAVKHPSRVFDPSDWHLWLQKAMLKMFESSTANPRGS